MVYFIDSPLAIIFLLKVLLHIFIIHVISISKYPLSFFFLYIARALYKLGEILFILINLMLKMLLKF